MTFRLWAAAGGVQQSMLQAIQVVLLAGGASIAPAIIGAVKDLLMGLLADKVSPYARRHLDRNRHSHISAGTALSPRPHLRRD